MYYFQWIWLANVLLSLSLFFVCDYHTMIHHFSTSIDFKSVARHEISRRTLQTAPIVSEWINTPPVWVVWGWPLNGLAFPAQSPTPTSTSACVLSSPCCSSLTNLTQPASQMSQNVPLSPEGPWPGRSTLDTRPDQILDPCRPLNSGGAGNITPRLLPPCRLVKRLVVHCVSSNMDVKMGNISIMRRRER